MEEFMNRMQELDNLLTDFDLSSLQDDPVMLWDQAEKLFSAIESQNVDLVGDLLDAGCPTHIRNQEGQLPLHIAAAYPCTQILTLILKQAGKTGRSGIKQWNVNSVDKHGSSALHLAAVYRFTNNVITLVNHGSDVSITDHNGWTALDYAILPPNMRIINIILDAVKNSGKHLGKKSLFTAIRNNLEEVFLALLPLQENLNLYSGCDTHILHYCLQHNKINLVHHLLKCAPHQLDVTTVDMYGENSLFHLCKCDRATPELTEKLILLGCRVNQPTISNEYPIDEAIRSRRADLVQVLLQYGALVNSSDFEGSTPLLKAVKSSSAACISLLLQHGADMRAVTYENDTVISLALQNHNPGLGTQFIQEGYNAHSFCLQLRADIKRGIIPKSGIFGMDLQQMDHFISCGLKVTPLTLLCRNTLRDYIIDLDLPYSTIEKLDNMSYYIKYIMMKDTVWSWISCV